MTAEILSVGTELLLGDIINTNAAYIAKELATMGIDLYHQTVVGDNPERLKKAHTTPLTERTWSSPPAVWAPPLMM